MENYNATEAAQKILDEIHKQYTSLKKLNIMILGKTGTGKSTLINNMFQQKLSDIGIGKPVTTKIRKIEKPNFPLAIYDTPGLELGGVNAIDGLLEEISEEIKKGVKSNDVNQQIHCIWYCVSTPSHRFEQAEIDFIKKVLLRIEYFDIPVIIVLTQSFSKKDAESLRKEIEKENLNVVRIVPVLAEDYEIDEEYIAKAYGLDQLSEITCSVVPDVVQNTFISVQCASLKLKKDRSHAVVAASAGAAAIIGATPISFSDAVLLVPEQISMLAGITAIFGLPLEKSSLTSILSATIGTAGTTVLGKNIVSGLIKMIPGVGSVVGGAISATTAAALTTALGEAYIVILCKITEGEMKLSDLTSEKGKREIKKIFEEQLKVKRTPIKITENQKK